jgi:hypothetical protein
MKKGNVCNPSEVQLRSFNGMVDYCMASIALSIPEGRSISRVSIQTKLDEAIGSYCLCREVNRRYFLQKASISDIVNCLELFLYALQDKLRKEADTSAKAKKTCEKAFN